jgi:serine/threonine protein kinase
MADLREGLQQTLGRSFTIERELSGGGMSRVFVALDSSLGRRVVVKVLPPELAASVSVDRFKREIMLAATLQHPHIVGVLTAGDIASDDFNALASSGKGSSQLVARSAS